MNGLINLLLLIATIGKKTSAVLNHSHGLGSVNKVVPLSTFTNFTPDKDETSGVTRSTGRGSE